MAIVVDHPPKSQPLSDEQVVDRVLKGDRGAFELIMRRYNQRLFRIARAVVRDDAEAEDAIQEAYVNAYFHLDQLAAKSRLASWLMRIVLNEARGRARRKRRAELSNHLAIAVHRDAEPSPESGAATREMAAAVERAIDGLPEQYRTVLLLRAVDGLSVEETAALLELSPSTVRTRLHRARALLESRVRLRTELVLPEVHRFLFDRCDRTVAGVLARIAELARPRA